MNSDKIKNIILKFNTNKLGYAFYHPKNHTVSINGGRPIPESIAIKKMLKLINRT